MWFPAPIPLFPTPVTFLEHNELSDLCIHISYFFFWRKIFLTMTVDTVLIPLFYFLSLVSIVCFYIFSHNLNFCLNFRRTIKACSSFEFLQCCCFFKFNFPLCSFCFNIFLFALSSNRKDVSLILGLALWCWSHLLLRGLVRFHF